MLWCSGTSLTGLRCALRTVGFERELERGAATRLRLHVDAAAVPAHDLVDDGEADARAFESLFAMQPLEHLEELVRVVHVEADAVVLDEVRNAVRRRRAADSDASFRVLARELDGVRDEIDEDLSDEVGIADRRWQRVDLHVDMTIRLERQKLRHDRASERRHVDRLLLD